MDLEALKDQVNELGIYQRNIKVSKINETSNNSFVLHFENCKDRGCKLIGIKKHILLEKINKKLNKTK